MDTERLTVKFRDCECPGTPHPDGDEVYLRPALGFAAGAEALRAIGASIFVIAETGGGEDGTDPIIDTSRQDELVGPVYLREGPIAWNVVNEKGSTKYDPNVLLDNWTWGYPVAERCGELYTEVVTAPLLERMNALSKTGPNGGRTPATRRSSKHPRSPRRPSSLNGSAGQPSAATP